MTMEETTPRLSYSLLAKMIERGDFAAPTPAAVTESGDVAIDAANTDDNEEIS